MNEEELHRKLKEVENYMAERLEEMLEDKVIEEENNDLTGNDGEVILSRPELNKRLSHFRFSTDEFIDQINKMTRYSIEFTGNGLVRVIEDE